MMPAKWTATGDTCLCGCDRPWTPALAFGGDDPEIPPAASLLPDPMED